MPQICAAVKCNHTSKSCLLKKFPSDDNRLKRWVANMHRENWFPKSWERICECHFNKDQFELHRSDGLKRLRPDSVPTVFSTHTLPVSPFTTLPTSNINAQVDRNIEVSTDLELPALPNHIYKEHSYVEPSAKQINQDTIEAEKENISPCTIVTTQNTDQKQQYTNMLQAENYRLKKRLTKLRNKYDQIYNNHNKVFNKIFNEDQIQFLAKGRVSKWTKETIRTALQIRRIQKVPISCGINNTIMDVMEAKQVALPEHARQCVLSIDEMEVAPKLEYDKAVRQVIGKVTLGKFENDATKMLVLMLRGISVKWKQIIGVHLTDNNSATGNLLWNFVLEGVRSAEKVGLKTVGVVSDMGPSNQGMWAKLGICAQKNGFKNTYISHPLRDDDVFYIFPDVPHLLKNIKSLFLKHTIILPEHIVNKYNLPSDSVSATHVKMLMDASSNESVFKLAPQLFKKKNLLTPSTYEQMRVTFATDLLAENVSVALRTASNLGVLPAEVETTAWFIEQIDKWFKMMTSRHYKTSFTRKSLLTKHTFLNDFIELIESMETSDHRFKPVQKGIIISTLNVIHLSCKLLLTEKFNFLMTSRLTQDALENIFSRVRVKGTVHPSPLQALRAVRLISIAQYTGQVRNSNYLHANDNFYLDFLSSPAKSATKSDTVMEMETSDNDMSEIAQTQLRPLELDALHHFTGYVINKIYEKICKNCKMFAVQSKEHGYTSVTTAIIDKKGLKNPSIAVQLASEFIEKLCVCKMDKYKYQHDPIKSISFLAQKYVCRTFLPDCNCNFTHRFCYEFVNARIYFLLKQESTKKVAAKKVYGSKSANMHVRRKLT